jgi:uncharacterized protein
VINDSHQSDGLEVIEAPECRRLLASVPVGRIVFTDQAMPAVRPVNFVVHDGAIIVRTGEGSKLAAASRDAVVAFEADEVDPEYQTGWSVVVVGRAHEVTDQASLRELLNLPLHPWASGVRDHVIRIPIEVIYGHRVGLPGELPTAVNGW